jgi:hypothetical protein
VLFKRSSRFKVRHGTFGGFGGLSFLLKNGWKGLGLEDPSTTFFLRSTTLFDSFLNNLTMLSRYLGCFLGGLVNSNGFFPADLVSSDAGWLSKEINSFSTTLSTSKFWAKVTLSVHLMNMTIKGSNAEV